MSVPITVLARVVAQLDGLHMIAAVDVLGAIGAGKVIAGKRRGTAVALSADGTRVFHFRTTRSGAIVIYRAGAS